MCAKSLFMNIIIENEYVEFKTKLIALMNLSLGTLHFSEISMIGYAISG